MTLDIGKQYLTGIALQFGATFIVLEYLNVTCQDLTPYLNLTIYKYEGIL